MGDRVPRKRAVGLVSYYCRGMAKRDDRSCGQGKEATAMNEVTAENIRRYRERRSWTQEQLAEAAQVNLRTIQRAEASQPSPSMTR